MTSRRGILFSTAALFAVLLIVIYIGSRYESSSSLPTAREELIPESSPTSPAQMKKASSAHYQTSNYPKHNDGYASTAACAVQGSSCVQKSYTNKSAALVFELNTADSLDLVQLRGIGPVFARRIIKYRNLLGGFVSKSQLLEVYGMDSVRYAAIVPYLTVDAAKVSQIDLNSVRLEVLRRHPYLDYYQAKAIVQLRDHAGPYHTLQDLMQVPLMDQETYNKITPYLQCSSQPNK